MIDTSLLIMKNHDFLLVFYCNLASIMHRFVYNEVLKLTRNDVTAKSPLGGAVSDRYQFTMTSYQCSFVTMRLS